MHLKHLNLCMPDVPAAAALFTSVFGFHIIAELGNGAITVLRDDEGFILALNNFARETEYTYPRDFHFGFYMDTREEVNDIYMRLKEGGHTVEHEPRKIRDGWTFYCKLFDTVVVEITHHIKD